MFWAFSRNKLYLLCGNSSIVDLVCQDQTYVHFIYINKMFYNYPKSCQDWNAQQMDMFFWDWEVNVLEHICQFPFIHICISKKHRDSPSGMPPGRHFHNCVQCINLHILPLSIKFSSLTFGHTDSNVFQQWSRVTALIS